MSTIYEAAPVSLSIPKIRDMTLGSLVSAKLTTGLNRAQSWFSKASKTFKNNRAASSFIRLIGFLAVFFYLTYQLSHIGWAEIYTALPTSPLFYVLSLAMVTVPIMAEVINFQKLSGLKAVKHTKLFARKYVINEAVMSYAGEAYLVQRLAHLGLLELRRAGIIIKDLALVRTFSANFWLVLIVLATIFMGNSNVLKTIAATSSALAITVSLLSVSVCLGAILLFRKLTRLKFSVAAEIASIYLIRSFLVASILMTQWSIAIPGKAFSEWFVFLLVFSISKKSPIGGDLVFASVVVTLPSLGGNTPEIAAMLISIAAVTQVIYFLGFLLTSDFSFNRQKFVTT